MSSHSSPQLTQRQFSGIQTPISAEESTVEDMVQKMELEDSAFAATEARMATSGWSTETELLELRAKRQAVKREWEERIEIAKRQRRGSDGITGLSSIVGTMTSITTIETPVITLPNLAGTLVAPSTPQL